MRSLAGSAFLRVLLLSAFLAAGASSGATPVVTSEPLSGRSHAQALKAASVLQGTCHAQASAGEPDEIHPVNRPVSGPNTIERSGRCRQHLQRPCGGSGGK
jgi:hypothetical protein